MGLLFKLCIFGLSLKNTVSLNSKVTFHFQGADNMTLQQLLQMLNSGHMF